MTIDERVENLERALAVEKNRNRLIMFGLLVMAVAVVLTTILFGIQPHAIAQSGGKVADEIRARRIIVVDEKGTIRIELVAQADRNALALCNENGIPRAVLSVFKDDPGLILYDGKTKLRATLVVFEDKPFLTLYNADGKVSWSTP